MDAVRRRPGTGTIHSRPHAAERHVSVGQTSTTPLADEPLLASRSVRESDSYNVRSVERAITLLSTVADAHGPLGLTEIASRSGLSVPTAFRLARTLESANLLVNGDGGKYRLGARVLELSFAFVRNLDLPSIAQPYLAAVRDQVGESTSLILRSGDTYFHAAIAESQQTLRRVPNIGRPQLHHVSPGGLIFLAFDSEGEIDQYISRNDLKSHDSRMPSDALSLKKMLSRIRKQDFADSIDRDGLAKIAVPVRAHDDVVRAGIYVSGPSSRFRAEGRSSWLAAAQESAKQISRELGRPD